METCKCINVIGVQFKWIKSGKELIVEKGCPDCGELLDSWKPGLNPDCWGPTAIQNEHDGRERQMT